MRKITIIAIAVLLPFLALSQSGTQQEVELLKEKTKTLELKIDNLKLEIELLKTLLKEQNSKLEKFLAGPSGSQTQNANQQTGTSQSYSTPTPTTSTKSSSAAPAKSGGQCTAITQKGTRCSRQARSNGLCWQHGG